MGEEERQVTLSDHVPCWRKLYSFVADDGIAIGFRPDTNPVAYFNGDTEGIMVAGEIVRLWNREYDR